MRLIQLISLRHLRAQPARLVLGVLSIALGVAVVVAITVLNRGTMTALAATIEGISGAATLQVEGSSSGIDARLLDEVRAVAGVEAAAPMVLQRLESPSAPGGQLLLLGVDLSAEMLVRQHRSQELDRRALTMLATRPDAVLLSRGLAARANKQIGDTLILRPPSGGEVRTLVAGILEPEGPAKVYDDSLIVMPLPRAQQLFARAGRIDRIDIVTAPTAVAEVKERLTSMLAGRALVTRPAGRRDEIEGVLFGMRAMLTTVSVLALLVGAFLVYNTVCVALVERRREIAVLRAIGASPQRLALLFASEQLLIGSAGGALGTVLGLWGAAQSRAMFSEVVSGAYHAVELGPLEVGGITVVGGVATGAAAALLASIYPIWRELRVDPIVGLRGEVDDSTTSGGMRPRTRAVLLALAVFVVLWLLAGGSGLLRQPAITAGLLSIVWLFLLVGPVGRIVAHAARGLFSRWLGFPARLAAEHFLRADTRTVLTVLAIAIACALAFEVQVTLVSAEHEVMQWINRSVAGDIMVSRVGMLEPSQRLPAMAAETGPRIESLAGVKRAHPVRLARLPHRGERVLIVAFGLRERQALSFLAGDPEVALRRYAAGEGVLVSESFSETFDTDVGDTVDVPAALGAAHLPVLGVVLDYSWPKGIIFIEIDWYRRLFDDSLVDEFVLILAPDTDANVVREAVRNELSATYPDLFLVTGAEFKRQVEDMLRKFFMLSHAQSLVTLAVAAFGVLNTLLIAVLLRRRELAMLRAVGATRVQTAMVVAIEGALLGLAGGLLGLAFGAWIGYVAVEHASPEASGWRIPARIPWGIGLALLFGCIATSVIASMPPAWRASRWDEECLRELSGD